MSSSAAEEKTSLIAGSRQFVVESIAELKKITRPTRQETMQAATVTLVIMVFISICLFLLDLLISKVVAALLV